METKQKVILDMSKEAMYSFTKLYYAFQKDYEENLMNSYLDGMNSPYYSESEWPSFPIYCFAAFITRVEDCSNGWSII